MKIRQRLARRLEREKFAPSCLGALIHPFYVIRRRLHRAIADRAPRITGKVLDFGCGSQPYRHLFAHVDAYVGVDIEQSGHGHKRSRIDHLYDGKTLPFADASFDAVVSFEVLEHVFNLDRILGEIARVTRPGGALLLSVPFAWDEHEQPYDFARYTSFAVTAFLEDHGYEITDLRKTSTDIEAIGQLLVAYLFQALSPRRALGRAIFQLIIITPLTLTTLALSAILPAPGRIYTNIVVQAVKR